MNSIAKENYLNIAYGIGADLCRNAIWHKGKCNWLYADKEEDSYKPKVIHHPMSYNFYEGTCGVAFFLYNLYLITSEKIFLNTASGAIKQALFNAKEDVIGNDVSFYLGKTGLAYVMQNAAVQLNDNELYEQAETLFDTIAENKITSIHGDLIYGLSGMIPAFLLAGKITNKEMYFEVARQYGEHLLSTAIVEKDTLSWNFFNQSTLPHTGFAHGTSGMAYAFSLLFKFTNDDKFKTACKLSFNYEDRFYNKELNNWETINEITIGEPDNLFKKFHSIWCYGAAGMGLARIAAYKTTHDENYLHMATRACNIAMSAQNNMRNFTLCHGHFSNGELLLHAYVYLKNENYFKEAQKLADFGYKTIVEKDREWICRNKARLPTFGFMTGITGIGNFYLRMYNTLIPSGVFLGELLK